MKISLIALYHVSVPLRETSWPTWIPEFRKGIIDPILPAGNGQLPAFTRPGLGFEVDRG